MNTETGTVTPSKSDRSEAGWQYAGMIDSDQMFASTQQHRPRLTVTYLSWYTADRRRGGYRSRIR